MRATATAGASAYAGIVRIVTAAQTAKAPFIRLADRYALLLLPVTLVLQVPLGLFRATRSRARGTRGGHAVSPDARITGCFHCRRVARGPARHPHQRRRSARSAGIPFDGDFYSSFALNELESNRKGAVEIVLNQAMDRFVAEGREHRRGIHTFHGHGKPDAVFATFIEIHRPDLVVVGTHGRSGFQRLTIGSVTERLLNVLPCDVLVVPPPT